MFNEKSLLVTLWVKWIEKEEYTLEQVPHISNLYEEVSKSYHHE